MVGAVAGHCADAVTAYLKHYSGLHAVDAAKGGELLEPGFGIGTRQASLGSPVAVSLVVFDQSLEHRPIGRDLPFASSCGVNPIAIGIGAAAETAYHLGPCHFGYIGCV